MRQKIITVPKDKKAEAALDYDEATKDELIELVLNVEEFKILSESGIFDLINDAGFSNIDDYESDQVRGKESITKVIKKLNSNKSSFEKELLKKVEEIINLFEEALIRETGVYFYF
ncbi:hypothetical protein ACFSJW_02105 [Flavobacterium artemisiae]|uniref:Uncharacterized protein n=1 Tax=Flavobacterium artemisiae TaxID=2126556 RepID=A0ABW4HIR7_9FLAO